MKVYTNFQKVGRVILLGLMFALLSSACIQPMVNTSSTEIVAGTVGSVDSWQTYANPQAGFSIQYPAHWQVETLPVENSGQLQGVVISGVEGIIELYWGMGLGGACPDPQRVELLVAQGALTACYTKDAAGVERWEQINKHRQGTGFSARAHTSGAVTGHREMILQVLSTLSFQESDAIAD